MKTNVLVILLVAMAAIAHAQCVPDNQYNSAGVYPDSATNLPPACMNELYDVVVTAVVPYDTCDTQSAFPFPFTGKCLRFDSVQVKNPNMPSMNLPPNFTVACDPPNCMFPGPGPNGQGQVIKKCMLITGTPEAPATAVGDTFNLYVDVNAWLTGNSGFGDVQIETDQVGVDLDVDYYFIEVKATGQCNSGVSEEKHRAFAVKQNAPNPFNKNTKIEFTNYKSGNVDFKVYNMIGEIVTSETVTSKAGAYNIIYFNASHLPAGIYSYTLNNGDKTISRRMILMGK